MRRNPIPKHQLQYGQALRALRNDLHLTRTGLAKILEIDSSRLAAYELERVAVKAHQFDHIILSLLGYKKHADACLLKTANIFSQTP